MNTIKLLKVIYLGIIFVLIMNSCANLDPTNVVEGDVSDVLPSENRQENLEQSEATQIGRDLRIITLLPKDAIPSIDNPSFYGVTDADQEYDPAEIVLGVVFEGEARAYSVNMLSSHEIVNDVVAGNPIAVTW